MLTAIAAAETYSSEESRIQHHDIDIDMDVDADSDSDSDAEADANTDIEADIEVAAEAAAPKKRYRTSSPVQKRQVPSEGLSELPMVLEIDGFPARGPRFERPRRENRPPAPRPSSGIPSSEHWGEAE